MAKSTKIIMVVFCSLVAVLCVAIGVSTLKTDSEKKGENLPTISQNTTVQSTAPTETTTAKSENLSDKILGKWRDSADMSGFEFFEDGTVEITYVNLTVPIINIPVNGTTKGVYTIEGDKLTTKFTIYSATIEDTYTVSVNGNNLSMTNLDGNETTTYMRVKKEAETTTAKTTTHPSTTKQSSVLYDDELIGSWESYDGAVYSFDYDGNFELAKNGSNYSGIYLTDEGKITLQYADGSSKVTEKYSYTVTKNSLSLSGNGEEILLSREGTGSFSSNEDDLFGVWRDSTDMAGYEFKPGGICEITYMNFTIPVVNIPINGTFTGTYEVKGNKVTVSANVYGNAINDEFEFSVSGNTLRMKNTDTGTEFTYMKK